MAVDAEAVAGNCLGVLTAEHVKHKCVPNAPLPNNAGPLRVCQAVFPHMEMFGNPAQSVVLCGGASRPAWTS